jgi:hypothetical protein
MAPFFKKASTLNWENRKHTLAAFQELGRPHPSKAPGHEIVDSFERLSLN